MPTIQLLRGISSKRATSNTNLLPGQPFYETDTNLLYIGGATGGSIKTATPVRALLDSNGNIIKDTYATKIEVKDIKENYAHKKDIPHIPTLQDMMGSASIGSPTNPMYWDGEKFAQAFISEREITLETSSWDFIASVAEAGVASDYFKVGEEKSVTMRNGITTSVAIMGFGDNTLADESGQAGITFVLVDLYDTCSWSVNKYEGISLLPSEVTRNIRTVKRGSIFPIETYDLDNDYFKHAGLLKYIVDDLGNKTAVDWWLAGSFVGTLGERYEYVNKYGLKTATDASGSSYGRCFAFCV